MRVEQEYLLMTFQVCRPSAYCTRLTVSILDVGVEIQVEKEWPSVQPVVMRTGRLAQCGYVDFCFGGFIFGAFAGAITEKAIIDGEKAANKLDEVLRQNEEMVRATTKDFTDLNTKHVIAKFDFDDLDEIGYYSVMECAAKGFWIIDIGATSSIVGTSTPLCEYS